MSGATRSTEVTPLVIGLLCSSLLAHAGAQQPAVPEQPMIGGKALAFELSAVGEDTRSLELLRGRFVVMHFGASW